MTKGSIFLRAALFFCFSLVLLSENFTSERCFFITPVGQNDFAVVKMILP